MKRMGAFIAGAVTALAPVAVAGRVTVSSQALLWMFIAGAVLGMAACLVAIAPWGGDGE